MSDRKLGYAIICLFLFILFVLLAYCLRPLISPAHTRVIAFEKIGNLRNEDQVRVKGILSGTVQKIHWTREKVFVTIQTQNPITFHTGYTAATMDAGVMGDRMLMIDNGPENASVINAADTLSGSFIPGVSEAVGYTWRLREVIDSLRCMTRVLLHGDARHRSLVSQTKGVIHTVDSLSKSAQRFTYVLEKNISSRIDSIDNIVTNASRMLQSMAVSAPQYLATLDKQLAKAAVLVADIDTGVDALLKTSKDLSNEDNVLWKNDIEKLSGDLVRVQETLQGIQKELLQFKTYLRLW